MRSLPTAGKRDGHVEFEKDLITADGEVTNEDTREFLSRFLAELHAFIARVYTALPRNPHDY